MTKQNLLHYSLIALSISTLIGSIILDSLSVGLLSAMANSILYLKGSDKFKNISLLLSISLILSVIDFRVEYNGDSLLYGALAFKLLIVIFAGLILWKPKEDIVDKSVN